MTFDPLEGPEPILEPPDEQNTWSATRPFDSQKNRGTPPQEQHRRKRSHDSDEKRHDPKFRFKHPKSSTCERRTRSQSPKDRKQDLDDGLRFRSENSEQKSNERQQRHEERRERTRRKHRSTRRSRDKETVEDTKEYVDPDVAFRESLFDAMADDEGAQFWEGVYGQPIPKVDPVKETPGGGLEAMTDEEYVAHIRAEMYKKTHQHLLEEKARRDAAKQEREKLAEQHRKEAAEAERFNRKVEESLQRGKRRKMKVQMSTEWSQRWSDYEKAWEELGKSGTKIPWPVWGGSRAEIEKGEIEKFFLNAPTAGDPAKADLLKTLKSERVRWHPDKVQQKLGGQGADEAKIRGVTAVFQIIDRMWTELRGER